MQSELKAPKSQWNSFGKYNYRNCEDILEGLKPLLKSHGCVVNMSDEIRMVGERYYVCATAKVVASDGSSVESCAYAREPLSKKGMDDSQITGAASSYARKYALNGLFGIDDTKDADSDKQKQPKETEQQKQSQVKSDMATEKQRKAAWAISCKIWPGETSEKLKEFCEGMMLPTSSREWKKKHATQLIEALKDIQ